VSEAPVYGLGAVTLQIGATCVGPTVDLSRCALSDHDGAFDSGERHARHRPRTNCRGAFSCRAVGRKRFRLGPQKSSIRVDVATVFIDGPRLEALPNRRLRCASEITVSDPLTRRRHGLRIRCFRHFDHRGRVGELERSYESSAAPLAQHSPRVVGLQAPGCGPGARLRNAAAFTRPRGRRSSLDMAKPSGRARRDQSVAASLQLGAPPT
jgi:hypothetical protein